MERAVTPETFVQYLKSVGPARARSLARLGIETVGDLLGHYPRRYIDRSTTIPIVKARPGPQEVTIRGEVLTAGERRTRRGGTLQTVSLGDDSGVIFCTWFNQRYILKQFRPGRQVTASGLVHLVHGRPHLIHPDFELASAAAGDSSPRHIDALHTGRLVPIYGLTAGVGQHWLRGLVHQALQKCRESLTETLPGELLEKHGLPSRAEALRQIHFPADQTQAEAARRRLVYEEILLIQLLMALRRRQCGHERGVRLAAPGDLTRRLVASLPFTLTGAQRRVLAEILADMRSGKVMHRLLQGDVGSGKTLVALIAALFVIEQGYQAVFMAPTEVLARQHQRTIEPLVDDLGVTVETLTGATRAADRRAILAGVGEGAIDLLIGTHAVIQEGVQLPRLALSVVDEQHRFGVLQRGKSARRDQDPGQAHVLVMSATPIPRSLALTLYGDLDLSLLNELPAGRRPVATRIVLEEQEEDLWEDCRAELAAGRQLYVVLPLIEETEGQDLKAAKGEFARLAERIFPEFEVALLHGKLKPADKNRVMEGFATGAVQILVATTVVEVGLDVPNASAMVLHNPERFGLAQLHQLRGRIGRGSAASRCWLLCDRDLPEEAWERLRFFAANSDGFALAEEDLRLRGPGDAWGVRQHGAPGFRLANPLRDAEWVRICRRDAEDFLARDPQLASAQGRLVAGTLAAGYDRLLPPTAG